MKVICLRWAGWASVARKSKIGSCKSAGDYNELPWINRHMSISEWEAHCLLVHECDEDFRFPLWLNFACLITACWFFCRWSDHERSICCYDLVYGNSKIVWKFKSSMLLYYGSCFFVTFFIGFFETISHVFWSVILAKFSCSWSIMTKGIMSRTVNHLYQTVIEPLNCLHWRVHVV